MDENRKRMDAREEISVPGVEGREKGASTSLALDPERFRKVKNWSALCRGWGLVVAHRLAGGTGYPRVKEYAGKGSRGSKSDLCGIGEAFLMVEEVLKSRAPVDRKILIHCYVARQMPGTTCSMSTIGDTWPQLVEGHQGAEQVLRACRSRLANYAIGRLKL